MSETRNMGVREELEATIGKLAFGIVPEVPVGLAKVAIDAAPVLLSPPRSSEPSSGPRMPPAMGATMLMTPPTSGNPLRMGMS